MYADSFLDGRLPHLCPWIDSPPADVCGVWFTGQCWRCPNPSPYFLDIVERKQLIYKFCIDLHRDMENVPMDHCLDSIS